MVWLLPSPLTHTCKSSRVLWPLPPFSASPTLSSCLRGLSSLLEEETGPFTTERPVRMDPNPAQSLEEKCIVDLHGKGSQCTREQVPKGTPPAGTSRTPGVHDEVFLRWPQSPPP